MLMRAHATLEHQLTELQALVRQLLPDHAASARNLFDSASPRILASAGPDDAHYAAFRLLELERALFP